MITIFTPTYNRKKYLYKLKKSLDKQTNKEFEWVVVDDGSNDGTEDEVESWKKSNLDYDIKYIKQENQGKHIAFNLGVKKASYNWIICVDSDDTLTDDAVMIINHDIQKTSHAEVGIIYPRIMTGSNINDESWEKIDNTKLDVMDLHDLYHINESAIVMKKSIISKYQFPKFGNEKFLPESWLYQKLIAEGKFWALNKPLYCSKYLQNGLTNNIWKLWKNNPNGVLDILREKYYLISKKYKRKYRFIDHLKCIINLNTLCIVTNKNFLQETPSKFLSLITYLPSLYFVKLRYR